MRLLGQLVKYMDIVEKINRIKHMNLYSVKSVKKMKETLPNGSVSWTIEVEFYEGEHDKLIITLYSWGPWK